MNRFARHLIAVLTVLATAGPARAAMITFDSPAGPSSGPGFSWAESGFVVEWTNSIEGEDRGRVGNWATYGPSSADNGTFYAYVVPTYNGPEWGRTLRITASDGGAFTLNGFDGAENPFADDEQGVWATTLRVTGIRSDATSWSQDFFFDLVNDGPSGLADFQSFVPSLFDVFVEVQISGLHPARNRRDFSIDNIDVTAVQASPVPEPATWMLMSNGALVLLARQLRRRT